MKGRKLIARIIPVIALSCNDSNQDSSRSVSRQDSSQTVKTKPVILDSNVYLDIDMFSMKGIEKVLHPIDYPYIVMRDIDPTTKRVVFKQSNSDSVEKIYKLTKSYWTSVREFKADTGYAMVYEYIMPEKIIELDYLGSLDKTNYHLHDVSITSKHGSTSYGFGGEKGIKAAPHPDRFEEVKKVATTIIKDTIYEKNNHTINIWRRVDTDHGGWSHTDSTKYNIRGRSWHWIQEFGFNYMIK